MFIECTFLFRLCVSLIFRQFNCLLILRCLCNCAQCDYGLFGGGLIVIVNHVFSRRSRIFLKGRPISCEVPTRRDSVGGEGVVAQFSVVSESRRDSVGGGGSSRIFPWSPKAPCPPPLNRPLVFTLFYLPQC